MFPKNFARNYEKKNNIWNIRRLVDESFVPAIQHIILKIVGFTGNLWLVCPQIILTSYVPAPRMKDCPTGHHHASTIYEQ